MNEMRHDWLSDRWVIYAPNRTTRPDDYDREIHLEPESHLRCPFCIGSEEETPQATLVLPQADRESTRSNRQSDLAHFPRSDWLVRVVPNKFPAVTAGDPNKAWPDVEPSRRREACCHEPAQPADSVSESLFLRRQTSGAHEVIIETPQHVSSITRLPVDHVALILEAYRQRLVYWRAHAEMKYAVIFKNYGADAGATLVHSHSQLIGTNFVPTDVQRVHRRLASYYRTHHQCYWCDLLEQELACGERTITSSEHFVAICPFASRFPFSVSVLPRRHRSSFEECSQEEIADFSQVVLQVLKAIEAEHPRCAYNYVLQTSPFDCCDLDACHWRFKIIPRLNKVAGFEWSSDCFINTVFPETAAQALRTRIGRPLPSHSPACPSPSPVTRKS